MSVRIVRHADLQQKIPSKLVEGGCPCRIVVKKYPGHSILLGKYRAIHSHAIGNFNLMYTRIPKSVRENIAQMLRNGIESQTIVSKIQASVYHDPLNSDSTIMHREQLIISRDVRRIKAAIDAEEVRLHRDDGESVLLWIEKLRQQDMLLGFKRANEPAEPNLGLDTKLFYVIIQTPRQRSVYSELGGHLICVDGTHNVTQYSNSNLYTLLCRDKWGHGAPVAYMLASNGCEETLAHFFRTFKASNPLPVPCQLMTDRDQAQINAAGATWPSTKLRLCWWHVLHAWQQHFRTSQYPELWDALQKWIRIANDKDFKIAWEKIQGLAPESVTGYLEKEWLPPSWKERWSAVDRQGRTVLESVDTNMLIEAWHHVLKAKFLNGKRNRRADHLLHILTGPVEQHYHTNYHRQQLGFEGPSLEVEEYRNVVERSKRIVEEDIKASNTSTVHGIFTVCSQSNPGTRYEVNLDRDDDIFICSCPSYPRISYCKHIHAVLFHHPEFDISTDESLDNAMSRTSLPSSSFVGSSGYPVGQTSADRPTHGTQLQLLRSLLTWSLDLVDSQDLPPSGPLNKAIDALLDLKKLFPEINHVPVLPKAVALPPNINTANETARAYNHGSILPPLRKKKDRNPEIAGNPYSGGEQSGKRAKADARGEHPQALQEKDSASAAPSDAAPLLPSRHISPLPTRAHGALITPIILDAEGEGSLSSTIPTTAPLYISTVSYPMRNPNISRYLPVQQVPPPFLGYPS